MKKGAKIISIVLALVLIVAVVASLAACNKKSSSDWENVKAKGYLTCGITLYSPMNYIGDDDELTGFETELAKATGEKLGIPVKFQIISWEDKFIELNSKYIDCIWNGFTIKEERKDSCDFTKPYLKNSQVAVIKIADAAQYTSADSFAGKKASAESGSTGYDYAKELTKDEDPWTLITKSPSQMSALTDVVSNNSNFAVVDYVLAKANCGTGSYSGLQICTAAPAAVEYFAVGFRKGSDITDKVNAALADLYKSGYITSLAQKYGFDTTDEVVPVE